MKPSLLIALLLSLPLVPIKAQDLVTYYAGKRIVLQPDNAQVSVKLANTTASVAKSNLGETQVTRPGGWARILRQSDTTAPKTNTLARSKVAEQLSDANVAFASPVFVTAKGEEMAATQSFILKLKAGQNLETFLRTLNNPAIVSKRQLSKDGTFLVTTNHRDGTKVLDLAASLAVNPAVQAAQVDFRKTGTTNFIPSDPGFSRNASWGLRNPSTSGGGVGFDMKADTAWDVTTGSASILVAVFDGGVQQNHPEINQIPGRDFTDEPVTNGGTRTDRDGQWHGTAVAGCISGRMNNGIAACGIAPNVRVVSVRFSIPVPRDDGSIGIDYQDSWLIEGLEWAESIGARVSVHSYSAFPSGSVDEVFASTRSNGMIHFAATGNSAEDIPFYDAIAFIGWPASSPSVLGVGAAEINGTRASFSQWKNDDNRTAQSVDFLAPGKSVASVMNTDVTTSEVSVSGTSFAAPYAAGVAALVLSQRPELTPAQVESKMIAGCRDMSTSGYDKKTGFGLVNAFGSLSDDHGNTRTTATNVAANSSTKGFFSSGTDDDFFKFTLSDYSEMKIWTTGDTVSRITLLNSAGTQITSAAGNPALGGSAGEFTGWTPENPRMVSHLAPGTYFIKMRREVGSRVAYTLRLARSNEAPEIEVSGNNVVIASGDTTPSSTDGTSLGNSSSTFTIKNTGRGVLRISNRFDINGFRRPVIIEPGIGDIGPGPVINPDDFVDHFPVTVAPAAEVLPGQSTTFTVKYSANDFLPRTCTLTIKSNDSDEGEYKFTVSGKKNPQFNIP